MYVLCCFAGVINDVINGVINDDDDDDDDDDSLLASLCCYNCSKL